MIIYAINMESEDFKCKCGNVSSEDGFYPCNIYGVLQEPEGDWEGHYRCDRCLQVYLHKED